MVFFPIYDEKGKLVSYGSRKPIGKSEYYYPDDSPHMDYLYGECLKISDGVFIVEGMLDAIAIHRAGYSVLATFNTNYTSAQLNRLQRFVEEGRCSEYIVMYDTDASDNGDSLEFELASMGVKVGQSKLEYGDPGDKTIEQMCKIIENLKKN